MFSLGVFSFTEPLAFIGLPLALVIWWFLRLQPPAPRRLLFPAIGLLSTLDQKHESPELTPFWLIILRVIIFLTVILAAAYPIINLERAFQNKGPVFIIIDNDWASARDWVNRRKRALELVAQAERDDRPIAIIATAKVQNSIKQEKISFTTAINAAKFIKALQPMPWISDRNIQ